MKLDQKLQNKLLMDVISQHFDEADDLVSLLVGPTEKECFQTDDWGYGKEWQK